MRLIALLLVALTLAACDARGPRAYGSRFADTPACATHHAKTTLTTPCKETR